MTILILTNYWLKVGDFMNINEDKRKLTIEIISNLANIKNQMYEMLLKPSGITNEQFLYIKKNRNIEGKYPTKREIAQVIISSFKNSQKEKDFIYSIIMIAAEWKDFHLSKDEYAARGIVEKAKEIISEIRVESNESQLIEKKQYDNEKNKQINLLLMMYDEISSKDYNLQERGYRLEDLINRLFEMNEIAVMNSFRRNNGGEQIDGAFKMEGWYYIAEMKWTKKLSDMNQLDSLYGKVSRSGKQTMGVFISINGWSPNVIPLMKQQSDKSIFLMDGYDLRMVLSGEISLTNLLKRKIDGLNLITEPFVSVSTLL